MLNYTQNQVSFLVYRYSSEIVDDLVRASERLAAETGKKAGAASEQAPLAPAAPATEE